MAVMCGPFDIGLRFVYLSGLLHFPHTFAQSLHNGFGLVHRSNRSNIFGSQNGTVITPTIAAIIHESDEPDVSVMFLVL
jgi:hypothetical protein